MKYIIMIFFTIVAPVLVASPDHSMPAPAPQSFDMLKKLVGTWEGTMEKDGKKTTFKNVYELTSGGSALIERTFAGEPHEMVSIYSFRGDKVAMTHYCMLGNQPEMQLIETKPQSLHFAMTKTVGIDHADDHHMHDVVMTWKDDDHIEQQWQSFDHGKSEGVKTFTLTRQSTGKL